MCTKVETGRTRTCLQQQISEITALRAGKTARTEQNKWLFLKKTTEYVYYSFKMGSKKQTNKKQRKNNNKKPTKAKTSTKTTTTTTKMFLQYSTVYTCKVILFKQKYESKSDVYIQYWKCKLVTKVNINNECITITWLVQMHLGIVIMLL